jgi:DNA mismatch repair ATPase MutL
MKKNDVLLKHEKNIRQLIYKTINQVQLAQMCELLASLHGLEKKKETCQMPSQRGL